MNNVLIGLCGVPLKSGDKGIIIHSIAKVLSQRQQMTVSGAYLSNTTAYLLLTPINKVDKGERTFIFLFAYLLPHFCLVSLLFRCSATLEGRKNCIKSHLAPLVSFLVINLDYIHFPKYIDVCVDFARYSQVITPVTTLLSCAAL